MRNPLVIPALRVLGWILLSFPTTLSWLRAGGAPPPPAPGHPVLRVAGPVAAAANELPFVYTQWKHFTVKEGLPNDHVFAVRADGPRVWIGTEDGLACLDKRTGAIRSCAKKTACPGA